MRTSAGLQDSGYCAKRRTTQSSGQHCKRHLDIARTIHCKANPQCRHSTCKHLPGCTDIKETSLKSNCYRYSAQNQWRSAIDGGRYCAKRPDRTYDKSPVCTADCANRSNDVAVLQFVDIGQNDDESTNNHCRQYGKQRDLK